MSHRSPKDKKRDPESSSSADEQEAEMIGERISTLELKVAYHERLNQELSDQVYTLHQEIDILRRNLNALKQALERQDEEGLNIGPADDPPPHY